MVKLKCILAGNNVKFFKTVAGINSSNKSDPGNVPPALNINLPVLAHFDTARLIASLSKKR